MKRGATLKSCVLLVVLGLVAAGCASDSGVSVLSRSTAGGVSGARITTSTEGIELDDDVRTGTLGNGLRYFIRHSERPGRKAELRLSIDAGSALEDDDQSGVAHFLEHMLFNGTEKYERNDLIEVLQQSGVEFGADINAYTSYDETVYQLTVDSEPEEFELGLDILHQWLTAATLTEDDVIAERGVVLDEYRVRELTADGRVFTQLEEIYLGGTAYAGRPPIGSAEAISTMTPQVLRNYYDAWYRPDNAAVVVVGDIDVDDVEDQIEDLFGDVQPRGESPARPVHKWAGSGAPRAEVITDPDLISANIELSLPTQQIVRDTVGARATEWVDYIATVALANRLSSDLDTGAPFDSAAASSSSYVRALDAPSVYLTLANEEAGDATAALLDEYARIVQFGFSEADIERAVAEVRAGVETAYEQRDTIQAVAYADRLVTFHLLGTPLASAADEYDIDSDILDRVDAELVNEVFLARLAAAPPVLTIAVKDGTGNLPTEEELVEQLRELASRPVAEREEIAAAGDMLMEAPEPAEIVDRDEIDAVPYAYIEPTMIEFANGVRVVINQTPITDDYIVMYAVSPGGFALTAPEDAAAAWLMNEVNSESGFGSLTRSQVDQILSASTVDLFPYVSNTTEFIGGSSSPGDLELAFQVMNQYISASNFSQVALDDAVQRNLSYLVDLGADADLAVQVELNEARYGNDPRFRILLTEEELKGITTADLERVWLERFGDAGDFVFILSGDLDLETTIELAARYLGTLPATGEREAAVSVSPPPPTGIVERIVRAGSGDTASLTLQYTTNSADTSDNRVLAGLLTSVLNIRLTNAIREQAGASYSPNAAVHISEAPDAEATVTIAISGAPDDLPRISSVLQDNLDDLRTNGPTAEEFSAAVAEATDSYNFISDAQIVEIIERWLRDPTSFDDYNDQLDTISAVTRAQLRAFTERVMPATNYIEITQLPRE